VRGSVDACVAWVISASAASCGIAALAHCIARTILSFHFIIGANIIDTSKHPMKVAAESAATFIYGTRQPMHQSSMLSAFEPII
jgi:hypothetical protein